MRFLMTLILLGFVLSSVDVLAGTTYVIESGKVCRESSEGSTAAARNKAAMKAVLDQVYEEIRFGDMGQTVAEPKIEGFTFLIRGPLMASNPEVREIGSGKSVACVTVTTKK